MNTQEYKRAFAIADETSIDLTGEDIEMFDGYGLRDFQPIVATVRQVARLMRWQALSIYNKPGQSRWNMEELNDLRNALRKKVTILN